MRHKLLMLCGMLAPLIYLLTVILGGVLRPGYSHLAQYVSELIETGAPNKSLLDPLFLLYNLLTILFGLGFLLAVRAMTAGSGRTQGTLGALFLVAEGIFGFATVFFPQDPIGSPATSTGTMHIILASFSSLTTMLTILFMGLWFRYTTQLRGYALYSFVSLLIVFVSGGMAAASIAHPSAFSGLLERITIGGFLQWLFVVALRLYPAGSRLPAARA